MARQVIIELKSLGNVSARLVRDGGAEFVELFVKLEAGKSVLPGLTVGTRKKGKKSLAKKSKRSLYRIKRKKNK